MNKTIVITGPTATGKTALSVKLAKELSGEIVSCDSIQIYKQLNIGSAKPSEEEKCGIMHHLMDFKDPNESYSVADYVKDAKEKLDDILSRKKTPIVVGGTGLYISSLVDNVEFSNDSDNEDVRARLLDELDAIGPAAMHEKLAKIDKDAAESIHPNNTKRVIRALEIYEITGKTKTEHEEGSKTKKSPYDFFKIALSCERELLYERINRRVDVMVNTGLFDEVRNLLASGILPTSQAMQGIGYKEVVAMIDGKFTEEESIELIKKNSRNYAKRQLTWFRRCDFTWFDCTDDKLYEKVRAYIGEFGI